MSIPLSFEIAERPNFRCVKCSRAAWKVASDKWRCLACNQIYPCSDGIPHLYRDEAVPEADKQLKRTFYESAVGRYYDFLMPFLTMPARPLKLCWRDWLIYIAVVFLVLGLVLWLWSTPQNIVAWSIAAIAALFLWKHSYLGALLVLAFPVKISLLLRPFRPNKSFIQIHSEIIADLAARNKKLQILDVSTGNCASLYKHGWMKLDANYSAVDFSPTMLAHGQQFMASKNVPVQFAIADAHTLPFDDDMFDVVLNYGAINGMGDPGKALSEMSRVAKPGGLVLFFDEQLYPQANLVERIYFKTVLSGHNTVHSCPRDVIPSQLADVQVHQVYQFYYLCTATKLQ